MDSEVLGGANKTDPFDSARLREAGNLMKRVCTKQVISGAYAISATRDGAVPRIYCGFETRADRDAIAELAGAGPALSGGTWASRRQILLDTAKEQALNAAAIPRDNKGAGRRARKRDHQEEEYLSLRWLT